MRRRDFTRLAAAALTGWPLVAHAQQTVRMRRIGRLFAGGGPPGPKAFAVRLAALGYVEGRDFVVENRQHLGRLDLIPELAAELVRLEPDIIIATGPEAVLRAVSAATSSIPILMLAADYDPVALGFVASLARPGGNVTGVSFLANTLIAKQLQLLQGLLPASGVIGVLVNPGNPNAVSDSTQAQAAATSLRLKVHVVNTLAERDFDAAFDDLGRAQVSAILVFPDALFTDVRGRLAELATRHKLPVLYPDRSYVEAGGLMSYGSSRTDAYREAGIYVGRILRGEKPSELPVIQASKFELVINLKAAKALSLEIPPILLALADEVIE